MKIEFKIKLFKDLLITELYEVLKLRSEVFVVEQNCVYLDADGKDEMALHVLGFVDEKLVAYARVFGPGLYFDNTSIGRVIVHPKFRMYGYGHLLIDKAIEVSKHIDKGPITISAQQYLEKFYLGHGFKTVSDMYLEDDIPHIEMLLE
jgi:ElaA protein